MGDTTQEIFDEIMASKDTEAALSELIPVADNSQKLLADLKTVSKTAEYRLWAFIVAYAQNTMNTFYNKFVKRVESVMNDKEPGTLGWWRFIAINFQLGYLLTWIDSKNRYEYSDTTSDAAIASKIIKFCAVDDTSGIVLIKVAKDNGSGLPANLDGVTELSLAQAYFERKRPAGVRINAISLSADLLKITGTIYYDPLVTAATIKAATEAAILSFNNLLPFNGRYNLNKLIDSLQSVDGIRDIVIASVQYKIGSNPYVTVIQEYQTEAGYVKIDTASGNTLDDTLTYTPYV